MTQKETLEKFIPPIEPLGIIGGIVFDNTGREATSDVGYAMDEYARQEAIEFGPWLGRNYYYIKSKERWYGWAGTNTPLEGYTIEDIYDIYQQQKQK